MFYRLPPVGNRIELRPVSSPHQVLKEFFGDYRYRLYGSGTSALAAALVAAIQLSSKPNPEVLIPAYTCPALVSAALRAGARPILVDFERHRPWVSLDDLQRKISPHTVAIIAVHLFGIPERVPIVQDISKNAGIFLIEDSAQYLPERDAISWQGDFVILSFGRGKPVSLLGGGAVLSKVPQLIDALPVPEGSNTMSLLRSASYSVKVSLHNIFLSPHLYWVPASLPFLHLGETTYTPLETITACESVIVNNLAGSLRTNRRAENCIHGMISQMLRGFDSATVVDLPAVCGHNNLATLFRYPLLVLDPSLRHHVFQRLNSAGLGASTMYPCILPRIAGLENVLNDDLSLPNSDAFAQSILTLPTHSGVKSKDIERIADILNSVLPQGAIS